MVRNVNYEKEKIKLFVVGAISFSLGVLIFSSSRFVFATLFSFYYHDRVFTPLQNRLYNMNKKGQRNRLRTRTFLWLSHLQVSDPSWEVLLWRSLQPLKITWTLSLKETILSYYQSTKIFCEPWKGSFVIKDNISFEKNLPLTVKIFQFLRLSTNFCAVLRLSVNPIETLL